MMRLFGGGKIAPFDAVVETSVAAEHVVDDQEHQVWIGTIRPVPRKGLT